MRQNVLSKVCDGQHKGLSVEIGNFPQNIQSLNSSYEIADVVAIINAVVDMGKRDL
jgi:hypothetical protein